MPPPPPAAYETDFLDPPVQQTVLERTCGTLYTFGVAATTPTKSATTPMVKITTPTFKVRSA